MQQKYGYYLMLLTDRAIYTYFGIYAAKSIY